MKKIKLEVGHTYNTRCGSTVTIMFYYPSMDIYYGCNKKTYLSEGYGEWYKYGNEYDIIEEVI